MPAIKKYKNFKLPEHEKQELLKISSSRTLEARRVQRAKIILLCDEGMDYTKIAEKFDINRHTVENCIKKYVAYGLESALTEFRRPGKNRVITDEDIAWILNIACKKPTEYGYAQELWTIRKLHQHVRNTCIPEGYPNLKTIAFSKIQTILNEAEIKPHKIKYYLEKRDPEFERKMHDVLVVYKQMEFHFEEDADAVTISYDEKPGIQAIANIVKDIMPNKDHGFIARDSEYKRLGTVSFLAGMDLQTGEIIPLVSDTHKSSDFIQMLKKLDEKYPEKDRIRIILDNHSAHTSKETQKYLETRPGRFEFVFTPKHGSWLNLIESFFSKMTRQFLRGIRVNSKEELVNRIYQYIAEINEEPVVYHWTYKMDEIDNEKCLSI